MKQITIDNLRKSTGTMPEENPNLSTIVTHLFATNNIVVELVDHNTNPYKTMFCAATATWGNNDYKNKWYTTDCEGKLEVIKAVLTHNTLPQARELVNFFFRVRGTPRWLFDRHTHVPFTTFMSIGCRDNNKLDTDLIVVTQCDWDNKELEEVFGELKSLYCDVVDKGKGSWQSARTFLPQGYQHSYYFGQNLLSMASMKFSDSDEDQVLEMLYEKVCRTIGEQFPLIGDYLQYGPEFISQITISDLYAEDKKGLTDAS